MKAVGGQRAWKRSRCENVGSICHVASNTSKDSGVPSRDIPSRDVQPAIMARFPLLRRAATGTRENYSTALPGVSAVKNTPCCVIADDAVGTH